MIAQRARKRVEVAARRRAVARLYLEGRAQQEIAALIGVSSSTVSRDLSYLTDKWRERAVEDIDGVRGRELAELEQLERECMSRYSRDRRLRWLQLRLRLKERKAKLLGLDTLQGRTLSAHKLTALTNLLERHSLEELRELADLVERVGKGGARAARRPRRGCPGRLSPGGSPEGAQMGG